MNKFLIFTLIFIKINLNAWEVTIHNQSKESVHVKLNTSQTYPCGNWYAGFLDKWCNCGAEFDVAALSTYKYNYKSTNNVCIGPCTTSIETNKGISKSFNPGICADVEAWIGKKDDGKWFINTTNLGYSHLIKNNTPWSINVYVDEATCHNDCWYNIPAGSSLPLNSDLCCIQAITWWATDSAGNFKGGSTGRFDLICHNTNWSIDKVGEIEKQPVYDIKKI
jgi:hypothetical protein